MSDPTLFRARLNGVCVEDTSDTGSPAGERQALMTFIKEDSDVTGGTPQQGIAKVVFANNAPCPRYAANQHFFQLLGGPTVLPIARAVQPKVIIRRDAQNDAGSTSCYSIVISPHFLVKVKKKWLGVETDALPAGTHLRVDFYDESGGNNLLNLGVAVRDGLGAGGFGLATCRMAFGGLPAGYTYAWMVSPVGLGDHAHLIGGDGPSGGGTAFACFAPSTKDEATALGYTDLT